MNRQSKRISFNKIGFLVIVFLFAGLLVRMYYVVLAKEVDGTDLDVFASKRNTKTTILYASRGKIFDYSGEPLAQNVSSYTLVAYLSSSRTTNTSKPQHVINKETTAKALAEALDADYNYILGRLSEKAYQVQFGTKGNNLTELDKKAIEELNLPGIGFIASEKRNYPNGDFASYLIGYAKKNESGDITGEMGVEGYYNEELKGIDGLYKYQQDLNGYPIPDTPVDDSKKPQTGSDIYLTIDLNIQMYLETALDNLAEKYTPDWAILTVMDAKTGAIVGSSTSPSFDPNKLNITNYNNPLISYTYEPGSTMKVFSYMAAMEQGVYDADEMYKSGTIEVSDATIKDHNTVGWGNISYSKGFTYSSNVAAVLLAKKVGKDNLKNYYQSLGFANKTGIELSGELAGKVNFKYDVEFANAAFGQGITVTPIQMLQAMSAVTNGGVMLKPYIIDKIVDSNTNEVTYQGGKTEIGKVANLETIDEIKRLMYLTVNGESAEGAVTARSYKTDYVTLIGKTGTAEKVGTDGKYIGGKYNYIRSFIGCFPYDNPEYIIYLVTDNLQGANAALGETIKEVVENISKNKFLDDEKSNKAEDIYVVPSFISARASETKSILTENHIDYIMLGDGDYIINQFPKASTSIYKSTKVILLTSSDEIKWPDIIGWSSTSVINLCNMLGVKYEFTGKGFVKEASIPKDTVFDRNTLLKVDLEQKVSKIEINKEDENEGESE